MPTACQKARLSFSVPGLARLMEQEAFPATLSLLTRLNRKPAPNSPASASPRISTRKEFHPNSTRTTQETCQLKIELLVWSSSTQILTPKSLTFPKLLENTWLNLRQSNAPRSKAQNYS